MDGTDTEMGQGKHILMVLPVMKGGGAERVASLLLNYFHFRGATTASALTSSPMADVIRRDLHDDIPLISLQERLPAKSVLRTVTLRTLRLYSSAVCKLFEVCNRPVPSHFAHASFCSQYASEVEALRALLERDPNIVAVAFLQPAIPILLLAAKSLPNRLIISERGNPRRLMRSRYGLPFIKTYYARADAAVFQTQYAKSVYPEVIQQKATVIPNPLTPVLPEAYHGKRKKVISTFCRIARQKNLPLLIDAFYLFYKKHPDYRLRIIGDAAGDEGRVILNDIRSKAQHYEIEGALDILPFNTNVHSLVSQDAMYVNSSDYEGLSNAMLEALALGMPVVCTDCPVGGAAYTVRHRENGLLVPPGDAASLSEAMAEIADNEQFSLALSRHAARIRDRLDIQVVGKAWLQLL